jgi:hypothetical protein
VIVLSLNIGSKLGTGAEAIVDMIGAGVRFYCCDYLLEHVVVEEKQVSPCASVCPTVKRFVDDRTIESHDGS